MSAESFDYSLIKFNQAGGFNPPSVETRRPIGDGEKSEFRTKKRPPRQQLNRGASKALYLDPSDPNYSPAEEAFKKVIKYAGRLSRKSRKFARNAMSIPAVRFGAYITATVATGAALLGAAAFFSQPVKKTSFILKNGNFYTVKNSPLAPGEKPVLALRAEQDSSIDINGRVNLFVQQDAMPLSLLPRKGDKMISLSDGNQAQLITDGNQVDLYIYKPVQIDQSPLNPIAKFSANGIKGVIEDEFSPQIERKRYLESAAGASQMKFSPSGL